MKSTTKFHQTAQRKKIDRRLASEDAWMRTTEEHALCFECGCDLCLKLIEMHEEYVTARNFARLKVGLPING